MKLRERLINIANEVLTEGVESSKDIISDNSIPGGFDDMGMSNVNPGEFAQEEITDHQNLENTASMSNDTDFEGKATNTIANPGNLVDKVQDMMSDLVDISAPDAEGSVTIVKSVEDNCGGNDPKCLEMKKKDHFGESTFAKIVEAVLGGKTCEEYLMEASSEPYIKPTSTGEYVVCKANGEICCTCDTEQEAEEALAELKKTKNECSMKESQYAGPRDFVADVRINASDVLNALKKELGDGSEALHVDEVADSENPKSYRVSMIDTKKLPKNLHVENVMLKLDGDTYSMDKLASEYPIAK